MPTPYVKKLADKHGVPVSQVEKKWDKAKKIAEDEGHKDNWAYITGVVKRMMNESSLESASYPMYRSLVDVTRSKASGAAFKNSRNYVAKTVEPILLDLGFVYQDTFKIDQPSWLKQPADEGLETLVCSKLSKLGFKFEGQSTNPLMVFKQFAQMTSPHVGIVSLAVTRWSRGAVTVSASL